MEKEKMCDNQYEILLTKIETLLSSKAELAKAYEMTETLRDMLNQDILKEFEKAGEKKMMEFIYSTIERCNALKRKLLKEMARQL